MKEDQVIKEINEEVVTDVVCEEVAKSNGNMLVKAIAGIVVIAAGVGATLFIRKKKQAKNKNAEVTEPEVIVDIDMNEE